MEIFLRVTPGLSQVILIQHQVSLQVFIMLAQALIHGIPLCHHVLTTHLEMEICY